MSASLGALLASRARRWKDKPLLIVPDGPEISYAQAERMAAKASGWLRARGVRKGDRVLLALPNVPEFFHLLFGAARLGAVAVPVDPRLKKAELARIRRHCLPKAAVLEAGLAAFRRALDRSRPAAPAPVRRSDPLMILYTSGTTGDPKGVVHTHGTILAKGAAIRAHFPFTPDWRALCLLPVCFSHPLNAVCLPVLQYGGTLVLHPVFDLENLAGLFRVIETHRVAMFSSVPTVLRLLLRFKSMVDGDLTSLRFVACGSAPVPPELAREFETTFGVPVLNCYGITETAAWIAAPRLSRRRRAAGAVGTPLGCRIKAVDGELWVRGPSVMKGYYRNPEASARALRGGWFRTGDAGRVDARGQVVLRGRLKDIIIRNGINIHPDEIDEVLVKDPAVAEAATVGAPHPLLGEVPVSFVVVKPGRAFSEPALKRLCRRLLADYKCPERFVAVEALPRGARGKVLKRELRRRVGESR